MIKLVCDEIHRISTLEDSDYISLVSTFTAMTDLQFNCSTCKKKFAKDAKKQAQHQKRLGCDGSVNPMLQYTPNYSMMGYPKIKYEKCIANFFDFKCSFFINYFSKYKNNLFPYEGGYSDQPNKFVEVMDLVHNLISEKDSEREQALKQLKRR